MASECVFCQRIEQRQCSRAGRGTVRFEPLNPVTVGHMLFVPTMHVEDASDEPWITAQVFEVAAEYARAGADFNLITSAGPDATQTVAHFHVHYVPRGPGDGLALPWTNQKKVSHGST